LKTEIKKWKEPWKHKEPGARLSRKALIDQNAIAKQSFDAKIENTQNVKVFCNKNIFNMPGLFTSFTVKVKIPLRKSEFMERVAVAFPELNWERS